MSDVDKFEDKATSLNSVELDEVFVELQNYNDEIKLILSPNSSTYTSLFIFITRLLSQYRISGLFSPPYIINEAYLRGEDLIRRKGQKIRNCSPWLRRTCFNVISELSRKEAKYLPLLLEPAGQYGKSDDHDFDLDQEMMCIKLAFQILDPADQELLNLKIVDGLSWKEIRKELGLRGINITETALRKRKERALKKLRDHYHRFNFSNSLDFPSGD